MNLREALEAAEIEVANGATEEEIWLNCPFCTERGETPDTRKRLGVNLRTGQAHCFNCEWRARGDYAFNKLQEALSTGEIQAAQDLRSKNRHEVKVKLPDDFELIEHHSKDRWNNSAYHYLRKRGVPWEQIKEKGVGYSLSDDEDDDGVKMAYRIVFPVYVHDKLRGLVGRDFTGKQEIPYKNSTGGKAIYNWKKHKHSTVCLLEGVFDTLAVERAARRLHIDANGLLGHDLTDDQLDLIMPYKRVILWLDPDQAGMKGLMKIPKKIPRDKIVEIVLPLRFKHHRAEDSDPDELEEKEIVQRLLHAERATEDLQLKLRAWAAFDD